MTLQRLIITFKPGELIVYTLYSSDGSHGPNTKVSAREVQNLTRVGLRQALSSLEGRVDMVGTSG